MSNAPTPATNVATLTHDEDYILNDTPCAPHTLSMVHHLELTFSRDDISSLRMHLWLESVHDITGFCSTSSSSSSSQRVMNANAFRVSG
mmetsp:Transcript_60627/g.88838  ORF Transcript_60627/g.88838 Transcript_60627/m.88838 type:complete len:89 (+) Transcript_60627:212-478(+)|eukprot:CAMPEP_0179431614 /NCGR_PEP_ID=MMETSP0799-20121207/16459_1 /TAXON_ID=46947 /ORGANISM="Geminigera cryophila, Strain CCMP2564" /LENGTH=88 /DNA_ID=CAMNT_0021208631 /DNA_START=199 /DNA_END=465 /DNA_ORIENTATION=+